MSGPVGRAFEVPGWFFLRSRRHADALADLDDEEAASLGTGARDLTAAVAMVTAAAAVYLLHFGENYRHFHAQVVARRDDIPADLRGGTVLHLRSDRGYVAAARDLAARVRSAYEQMLGARTPA